MDVTRSQIIAGASFIIFLLTLSILILVPKGDDHICLKAKKLLAEKLYVCEKCDSKFRHVCNTHRRALRNTLKHYCRKRPLEKCPRWSYCNKDLEKAVEQLINAADICLSNRTKPVTTMTDN